MHIKCTLKIHRCYKMQLQSGGLGSLWLNDKKLCSKPEPQSGYCEAASEGDLSQFLLEEVRLGEQTVIAIIPEEEAAVARFLDKMSISACGTEEGFLCIYSVPHQEKCFANSCGRHWLFSIISIIHIYSGFHSLLTQSLRDSSSSHRSRCLLQ